MECLEGGNGGTKRIQEAVRALSGMDARITEVMVVAVF